MTHDDLERQVKFQINTLSPLLLRKWLAIYAEELTEKELRHLFKALT